MKYLLFILFLYLFAESNAQKVTTQTIDSIFSVMPSVKEDTNKVNLYGDLLYYYLTNNKDSALLMGFSGLHLAEKLKWDKGINRMKENIGRVYWRKGNFDQALKFHFEALQYYQRMKDTENIANLFVAIGQDYADGGKFQEAIKYFNKAETIHEQSGNKNAVAGIYLLYSFVYSNQGNYSEAVKVNYQALKIFEQLGDKYGAAIAAANIADAYVSLGNYEEALKFYKESGETSEKKKDIINLIVNYISIGNVYKLMGDYKEAMRNFNIAYEKAIKINDLYQMASAQNKIGEVYLEQFNYREALAHFISSSNAYRTISADRELAIALSKIGTCQTKMGNYADAKKNFDEALALSNKLESKIPMLQYYQGVELFDSATGDWQNAYLHYKKFIIGRDSTNSVENTRKILQQQLQYEYEKKEVLAKAEQEKKDILQRTIRNSIGATLAGTMIFLFFVYRQRNKISKARKRSDELLLNILPAEVAEELKDKGSADAKQFDNVTVMFTDFKGFTKISERLSPSELVAEIHYCFKAFDNIIEQHNIEKIKTIGDSYMCAGGLPIPNTTNAIDVINAALEIQQFMLDHLRLRKKENKEPFEIRIGVHTGPVVAGIVGVKKFAYDIWGDTVNIASRMESSGESGKINISESTYQLVKTKFSCIYRGKIDAKNRGEIDMYFVDGKLDGLQPNRIDNV